MSCLLCSHISPFLPPILARLFQCYLRFGTLNTLILEHLYVSRTILQMQAPYPLYVRHATTYGQWITCPPSQMRTWNSSAIGPCITINDPSASRSPAPRTQRAQCDQTGDAACIVSVAFVWGHTSPTADNTAWATARSPLRRSATNAVIASC